MEEEWSCYRGGQFHGGRMVMWSVGGGGQFNGGRMVVTNDICLMEGEWSC